VRVPLEAMRDVATFTVDSTTGSPYSFAALVTATMFVTIVRRSIDAMDVT